MEKVCLLNLGCKVNQYEIDSLLNSLKNKYETTNQLEFADIYIVNTCAVTKEAEKKSRQMISKIIKINKDAKIYVCGCASQNNPNQFLNRKQVRNVFGNAKKGKILEFFDKKGNFVFPLSKEYEDDFLATNVRTRGYVKIQDGCNNYCSYCLIPYLRGFSRSRDLKSIVNEATQLSKTCKEIVLTGIDVSDYKIDNKPALGTLLKALSNLPCRIRLSSMEVRIINNDFLNIISSMPNFCPHFHLSLQSGCDKTLKDMNRHYTTQEYFEKVALIRKYFDNPAITTDIIVGYPTETDEDFLKTLEFVNKVKFSAVHFFAYSSREGTRASKLKQLNGKVIKERENKLREIVEKQKIEYLKSCLNKDFSVLIEKEISQNLFEGFSENYVKCYVQNAKCNQILKVRAKSIYLDGVKCEIID